MAELLHIYMNNPTEGGNILPSVRVLVKSYEYMAHFPKVYKLSLEFWRV